MLTLEQIQAALQDRRPQRVARACGVHFHTVRRIRDGQNLNPSPRVMQALSDYIERTTSL